MQTVRLHVVWEGLVNYSPPSSQAGQPGFSVFHPLLSPSLSRPSPDGSPSQPATHRMANNGFLFLFIGSRRIGSRSEHSICRYIARPPSPNGPHDSIRPLVLRPSSSLTRWTEIVVHPQRKRTMNAGGEKREVGDNGFHGALHELGASSANS